jgi:hypothetical protein
MDNGYAAIIMVISPFAKGDHATAVYNSFGEVLQTLITDESALEGIDRKENEP